MIDLIDKAYDTVFFYWHTHVRRDLDLLTCKDDKTYAGSVEEWFGTEYFDFSIPVALIIVFLRPEMLKL